MSIAYYPSADCNCLPIVNPEAAESFEDLEESLKWYYDMCRKTNRCAPDTNIDGILDEIDFRKTAVPKPLREIVEDAINAYLSPKNDYYRKEFDTKYMIGHVYGELKHKYVRGDRYRLRNKYEHPDRESEIAE